jgi:hypothetical protein
MSSCVPTSLYVLLDIFSKGFIEKNTPICGHNSENAKIVDISELGKKSKILSALYLRDASCK